MLHSESRVTAAAKRKSHVAHQHVKAGIVVAEAEDDAHVAALELWQQGDLDLYEHDKVKSRLRLRHDQRVLSVLQTWWLTAQRGTNVDDGTCEVAETIDFDRVRHARVHHTPRCWKSALHAVATMRGSMRR